MIAQSTPALQQLAADVYSRVLQPITARQAAQPEPTEICEWAKKFFYIPESLRPIKLSPYQEWLLKFIFPNEPSLEVKYPFTTVVWAEPKKSGKSAIGALVGRWAAETWSNFGEVYCCANDLEQSRGRNFAAIRQSIVLPDLALAKDPTLDIPDAVLDRLKDWRTPETKPTLRYDRNGSIVQAISGDYRGAAGANPSFILFSELWGYISENSRRLYAEMTTVPTRLNSVRWIETYAGYENESDLLWDVYQAGLRGTPVGEFDGLRNPDGKPSVLYNEQARMLFFWSHKPRQPWQTPEYYAEQRITLRPNEFTRLHGNAWVSRESQFIPPELWDSLESMEVTPLDELVQRLGPSEKIEVCVAVDASKNRDCTALIAVVARENPANKRAPFVDLALVRIWTPQEDALLQKVLIDLDQTVGVELRRLRDHPKIKLRVVAYDPYQLHSVMTTFAKESHLHVDVEEIPQTDRRIQTDTCLLDLIQQSRLRTFNSPVLREHILNAVAKSRPRGIRLDKEATSQKIDGAVALAMASWAALFYVPRRRKFIKV